MRFVAYVTVVNLAYIAAIFLDRIGGESLADGWVLVPYILSYFHGFVKRGLPGTLFDLLNLQPTPFAVALAYTLALEIFAVMFYLFVVRNARDNPLLPYMLILFILSPATFFHMGDDVGRTDVYLLLLFTLSLMGPRLSPVFTALAVLIHEGYALLAMPSVVGYLFLKGRKTIAIVNGVVGVAVAILTATIGRLGPEGTSLYSSILKDTDPLRPLILTPLENTVYFYRKFFLNPDTLPVVLLGFVSAILLFSLYYVLFLRTVRGPMPYRLIPLTPLLMFLFGIDYFRWVSFGTVVLAVWWVILSHEFGTVKPHKVDRLVYLLSLLALPAEVLKEILT